MLVNLIIVGSLEVQFPYLSEMVMAYSSVYSYIVLYKCLIKML